jgi:hypothetical protein
MRALTNIAAIALITMITVTLPAYLYLRGVPLPWSLALLAGYAAVAILSFKLGRRLE